MEKRSLQRDLIKQNLASRYDHPRNLRFLVEHGEALSLKLGDGREHFDGHVEPHYHFICTKCGAVEDIFMKEIPICEEAAKHCSGTITGHHTYFYGFCNNCKSDN